MQVQTLWESDSISPRYPRKLQIANFWRHFWPLCKTAPKIIVPDQGDFFGVGSPEDTRRRSISTALPNSSTIKRCDKKKKKRFLYIKQVIKQWQQVALLRCPARFGEFRSDCSTSYWNRMCTQTLSRRPAFLFSDRFSDKLRSLLYFSYHCIAHIFEQKM